MNIDPSIQSEVLGYLAQLGADDQVKVVMLARDLASSRRRGTSGQDLIRIAGSISHDDLTLMKQAIEEECERIDTNEW